MGYPPILSQDYDRRAGAESILRDWSQNENLIGFLERRGEQKPMRIIAVGTLREASLRKR
jgi:hypothetical protein